MSGERGNAVGHLLCPPLAQTLCSPPGGAGGLERQGGGEDKPFLQLRNLKSLEKHHAQGNLLLRRAHYLKPSTAHPAAELAGEPVPAHCCLGQADAPWLLREMLDPSVLQRCGIITMHYK